MKKVIAFIGVVVLIMVVGASIYVTVGKNNRETKMWEYLKEKNYTESDIVSVDVGHSFFSKFLGYGEWSISVVYSDEPETIYGYRIKNGEIVLTSVSGGGEKEELKHLY